FGDAFKRAANALGHALARIPDATDYAAALGRLGRKARAAACARRCIARAHQRQQRADTAGECDAASRGCKADGSAFTVDARRGRIERTRNPDRESETGEAGILGLRL